MDVARAKRIADADQQQQAAKVARSLAEGAIRAWLVTPGRLYTPPCPDGGQLTVAKVVRAAETGRIDYLERIQANIAQHRAKTGG